jgi:predicted RNase H-related nuclease YkuK (DUF458 family)
MQLNGRRVFLNAHGEKVSDLKSYVTNWLKQHPLGKVYVGCDSKRRGATVKYSTVVCLWNVGHGVHELYCNEKLSEPRDRFTRLWNEVTRAVEVAQSLKGLSDIHVHVDINSNASFKSHQLYDASIGLITSMGFKGAGKPLSWAATCGAHKHCQ